MRIREPKKPEAERITRELWLPLAKEMAEKSDYNRLKEELDIQQSIEHRRNGIREEGQYTFIAEDKELLGFISATRKESPPIFQRGDKMKVNELYVKPEVRRQGIATKLIQKVRKEAEKNGCDTLELSLDVGNDEADKFYQELGFETMREKLVKRLE